MMTTTELTYDDDLAEARASLDEMIPTDGYPEGEREKVIADALNDTWSEGMTIEEWVGHARKRIP